MSNFNNTASWFYKYDGEKFNQTYDFVNDLDTGEVASLCNASIFDDSGAEVADMLASVSTSSTNVTFNISGGTSGRTYKIKLKVTTDTGNIVIRNLTCDVYGNVTLNSKLGDPDQNSYVTIAQANDYIRAKYGHSSIWDTLDYDGKKQILIQAAKDISRYNFIHDKYYDTQGLAFPFDTHDTISGDVATPVTLTSFRSTKLYSTTYGQYPTDYWKYGSVHITAGTALNDIRLIDGSNVSTGSITVTEAFSATPTENSDFLVFAPVDRCVREAQIEQSLFIVGEQGIDDLQAYKNMGAIKVRIGDSDISFQEGALTKSSISPVARKLLSQFVNKTVKVGRG